MQNPIILRKANAARANIKDAIELLASVRNNLDIQVAAGNRDSDSACALRTEDTLDYGRRLVAIGEGLVNIGNDLQNKEHY